MTQNTTTTESTEAAKKVLKQVALPMVVSGLVQTVVIHLVGRKLFPNVFSSFGRTYGVVYLARLLTHPPKPTDEMKKISAEYTELSKIAR